MTNLPRLSPVLDDDTLDAIAERVYQRRNGGNGSKGQAFFRSDLVKMGGQMLVAGLLAYGVVNARVSVLESRVDDMKAAITEVRNDIKTLLQRVR